MPEEPAVIPVKKGKLKKLPPETLAWAPFVQACIDAGLPMDQTANFIKAGIVLQPKQLQMSAAARMCDAPDGPTSVGVGGARSGGKTMWMFSQIACDDAQRYPGLKILLLRKTAKAMREQIRDLLLKVCRNVQHNYREQAGTIEFPNGSFIIVGHFKDENEIENYIGQEYDVIAIEELTTLTFDKWKNLMTCLRTSKQNWRPRFYAAWNWGGCGHAWVKRIFYDPWKAGTQKETYYIKATIADNQCVNKENKQILETLTGWKYQSWYLGNPEFQAGQFFTNWNEGWHVFPNEHCKFREEREAVRWFMSMDYGYAHETAFLLHCSDKLGNVYTVDEHHMAETVIEEHAQYVLAMLKRHHIEAHELEFISAGKDCFSRKDDGKTIAMEYEENGLVMTPAEIDRVNAWAVMHQRLGDVSRNIKPTWFIHKCCTGLISQIPLAQCHEKRIGDIEKMNYDSETGTGGDDILEAARNGLVADPGGAISFAKPLAVGRYQTIGC